MFLLNASNNSRYLLIKINLKSLLVENIELLNNLIK